MSRIVREQPVDGDIPLYVNEEWRARFPFLVQGTTGRGDADFDLGLFRDNTVGSAMERWRALRGATRMPTAVHARQVHGAHVLTHAPLPPGLLIADDADAHVTATSGILLTISIADCVPVAIVAADTRAVGALHAGWRGIAGGVLEAGIGALGSLGTPASTLWVHFGPAICGGCYEVGPEVHEALGLTRPTTNTPVDLRAVLVERARRAGVPDEQISTSGWCTRCDSDRFFSHRGGSGGRQMSIIGMGPDRPPFPVNG